MAAKKKTTKRPAAKKAATKKAATKKPSAKTRNLKFTGRLRNQNVICPGGRHRLVLATDPERQFRLSCCKDGCEFHGRSFELPLVELTEIA